MAIIQADFKSRYLRGNTTVSLILPDAGDNDDPESFYRTERKYKTLLLLHGTEGDHSDFIRQTAIERYAVERGIAVVMPSCMNTDYQDWTTFGIGFLVESYITKELLPLVQNWFPLSRSRDDNFIAGISMGGRGSVSLAVNHPELFCASASLSGPPVFVKELEKSRSFATFPVRYRNLISNAGGREAFVSSPFNSWSQIDRLGAENRLPRLFMTIGEDDPFFEDYMCFKKHALECGYPVTFSEVPGYGHEWRFWDLMLPNVLDFMLDGNK